MAEIMKQEFDNQQTRRGCVQASSSYHHIPLPFTMQGSIIFLLLITAGHRIGQNNTKPRNEEHMFIITNNCNPEYFNQNAIIDNLRTEVLSMNERRLIYRRLINHLAYLSMMLILISNDVNPHPGPGCSDTNETVYPRGTCDQPVTWQERGIVCDTCNQWYHISCQSTQTKSSGTCQRLCHCLGLYHV